MADHTTPEETTTTSTTGGDLGQIAALPQPRVRPVDLTIPARTLLKIIVFVLGAWLLVDAGRLVAGVLLSIVIALFIAVAVDPAIRFGERHHVPRIAGIGILLVLLIGVFVGIALIFIPPLVTQSTHLAHDAPGYVDKLKHNGTYRRFDAKYHISSKVTKQASSLPNQLGKDAGDIVTTILSGLVGVVTVLFLVAFLLLEGSSLAKKTVVVWPQIVERRWWNLVQRSYRTIGGYVTGTVIVCLIDGVVIFAVLEIMRVPFALPLALWATIWGIIPIVGGFVGAAPAVLVAFLGGSIVAGIVVVAVALVYHVIIRAVLHPAIVGRAIDLSAFIVFVAVLLGDHLLGIIGVILAIPAAGIIQLVIGDVISHRANEEDPPVEVPALE